MTVMQFVLTMALVFGLAGSAHAEVDWARGLVTADGLGVADRHAPSPASAREPARRMAEDAARKRLAVELPALPLAGGGTLKDKLGDKAVGARIARAVDAAITVTSTPQTDGSWTVTLAVPIEAVRQALSGPRAVTTADRDPPIVIVEKVKAKPAVGYSVGGVAAPTLWVKEVPSWAKDAPRIRATKLAGSALEVATRKGGPATLFVILAK